MGEERYREWEGMKKGMKRIEEGIREMRIEVSEAMEEMTEKMGELKKELRKMKRMMEEGSRWKEEGEWKKEEKEVEDRKGDNEQDEDESGSGGGSEENGKRKVVWVGKTGGNGRSRNGGRKEEGVIKREERDDPEDEGYEDCTKSREEKDERSLMRKGGLGRRGCSEERWKQTAEEEERRKAVEKEKEIERMRREERKLNLVVKWEYIEKISKEGWIEEAEEVMREELGRATGIKKWDVKGSEGGRRMAIVTFRGREERERVWKKRKELWKKSRMEVDEDLTFGERKIRYKLVRKGRELREREKLVWIGNRGMVVDGEEWRWNEERERWEIREEEGCEDGAGETWKEADLGE